MDGIHGDNDLIALIQRETHDQWGTPFLGHSAAPRRDIEVFCLGPGRRIVGIRIEPEIKLLPPAPGEQTDHWEMGDYTAVLILVKQEKV